MAFPGCDINLLHLENTLMGLFVRSPNFPQKLFSINLAATFPLATTISSPNLVQASKIIHRTCLPLVTGKVQREFQCIYLGNEHITLILCSKMAISSNTIHVESFSLSTWSIYYPYCKKTIRSSVGFPLQPKHVTTIDFPVTPKHDMEYRHLPSSTPK